MPPSEFAPTKPTGSTATGSRVLAVINPASGDADPNAVDPVLDLLIQHLSERGIEVQVIAFAPECLAQTFRDTLGEDVRAILSLARRIASLCTNLMDLCQCPFGAIRCAIAP